MSGESAKRAHQIAAQITAARLRGDNAEANRLIQLFNQQLTNQSAPQSYSPKASPIATNYPVSRDYIPTLQESIQRDQLQSSVRPVVSVENPIPIPKPVVLGSLAEAIASDYFNKPPRPNLESQLESVVAPTAESDPFSYLTIQSKPAEPALPDFDDLIAEYHESVKPLLKQTLEELSVELQTPPQVLGPNLIQEFDNLWHTKRSTEPLLLKLPVHVGQRSVLMRYQNELLEALR